MLNLLVTLSLTYFQDRCLPGDDYTTTLHDHCWHSIQVNRFLSPSCMYVFPPDRIKIVLFELTNLLSPGSPGPKWITFPDASFALNLCCSLPYLHVGNSTRLQITLSLFSPTPLFLIPPWLWASYCSKFVSPFVQALREAVQGARLLHWYNLSVNSCSRRRFLDRRIQESHNAVIL